MPDRWRPLIFILQSSDSPLSIWSSIRTYWHGWGSQRTGVYGVACGCAINVYSEKILKIIIGKMPSVWMFYWIVKRCQNLRMHLLSVSRRAPTLSYWRHIQHELVYEHGPPSQYPTLVLYNCTLSFLQVSWANLPAIMLPPVFFSSTYRPKFTTCLTLRPFLHTGARRYIVMNGASCSI